MFMPIIMIGFWVHIFVPIYRPNPTRTWVFMTTLILITVRLKSTNNT